MSGEQSIECMLRGIREDRSKALDAIRKWPRLTLTFEDLTTSTLETAAKISAFVRLYSGCKLELGTTLGHMAGELLPRFNKAECEPDVRIELQAIKRASYRRRGLIFS